MQFISLPPRTFAKNPSVQAMFAKFAAVPADKLMTDPAIANHGVIVLKKLGEILACKGNHAAVLRPFAEMHALKLKVGIGNFAVRTELYIYYSVFTA